MKSPIEKFSLSGLRAAVTGASSWLGRHFAGVLALAGAEVFSCARRADKLAEVVAEINTWGGRAHAVVMDVTDRASVCAGLDSMVGIDVLVNNAGITDTKRLLEYTDQDWDDIMDTNLKGAWIVAQETRS